MKLYWEIGEENKPDPGLIPLISVELEIVIVEADQIWFKCEDNLTPPPLGYLIYDRATRKIVHERRLDVASPVAASKPKPKATPVKQGLLFWRRPRYR